MASSYTTRLRLELPVLGELSGTWGTRVNLGITELVDFAIAGYSSVAMTDADYTLTTSNAAADEARSAILNMTGTLTAARNVICPTASKTYIIKNATTGGFAITLKTSGGTGISIPNGKATLLYCDGTNVVDGITTLSSLTLGSALPVASGGTGVATLTGIPLASGTSAWTAAAAGTDYAKPNTASTWTAKQTFTGTSAIAGIKQVCELNASSVNATAPSSTQNFDVTSYSTYYCTANANTNWTVNFRASSGTSLDTLMSTGEYLDLTFIATNGVTPYYSSTVKVDGTTIVSAWKGGPPTSGTASKVEVYNYRIIKYGAAQFIAFVTKDSYNA